MKKNSFFTILIVIGIVLVLSIFSIRFCPFFYFFNIPCPGCGLTRAFICLLHGNIIQSLHYNILGVIFSFGIVVFLIFALFKKSNLLNQFIYKYRNIIYILAFLLFIIVWIININNPLLY